jgi:hypothetical protein
VHVSARHILLLPAAFLAACAPEPGPEASKETAFETLAAIEERAIADREARKPEYLGVENRLLGRDLVSFVVKMRRPQTEADVAGYSECAAAQYALIRGYGFARHVRTNVVERSGVWQADAVYTISPSLPEGLRTLDAEVTVSNCNENGIPTV